VKQGPKECSFGPCFTASAYRSSHSPAPGCQERSAGIDTYRGASARLARTAARIFSMPVRATVAASCFQ